MKCHNLTKTRHEVKKLRHQFKSRIYNIVALDRETKTHFN